MPQKIHSKSRGEAGISQGAPRLIASADSPSQHATCRIYRCGPLGSLLLRCSTPHNGYSDPDSTRPAKAWCRIESMDIGRSPVSCTVYMQSLLLSFRLAFRIPSSAQTTRGQTRLRHTWAANMFPPVALPCLVSSRPVYASLTSPGVSVTQRRWNPPSSPSGVSTNPAQT